MPDTHDERGGDAGVGRKPRIVPELTEELLRTIPVPIAAAVWQLMLREKLRVQLLAARAEKAEAGMVRQLRAAFAAGWHAHDDHTAVALATIRRDDRENAAKAWVREFTADAEAADAPQDGLSATETAEDGVQGSGVELEFGNGSAGPSEPEATE